jgi:hypothetical protein
MQFVGYFLPIYNIWTKNSQKIAVLRELTPKYIRKVLKIAVIEITTI